VEKLTDPAEVGNKFSRQASLRREGFAVPEFFCLSAAAFDAAVAALDGPGAPEPAEGCAGESAYRAAVRSWARRRHQLLTKATVGEPVASELLGAFDALVGVEGRVAVRACVVAEKDSAGGGEDGADDPFAGMSDSFLFVRREELLERVAACWASAFNPHAVQYRLARGVDPARARVAVGIQRMVPATRSFVAFSRDPRGADERCVIAAGYGLGEGVVQEKADTDHYFVARASREVEAVVVPKRRMVVAASGSGVVVAPVESGMVDTPVLTDAQAREVAELVGRVAAHFGGEQDVEGAVTADGRIFLLQARPALIAPAPVDDSNESAFWSRENVTESYPGVCGALTYSQALAFYSSTFSGLYRSAGVSAAQLRENERHLRRMLGWFNGRIYYRLDSWYVLHGQVPAFRLIRGTWERSMGSLDDAPGSSVVRLLGTVPRQLWLVLRHPRAMRRFLRWWDAFYESAGDLSGRRPDELIALYRAMWAEAGVRWAPTLVNTSYLMMCLRLTDLVLARWCAPDERAGDPGGTEGVTGPVRLGLLCGGPPNRSVAAVRSAIALAQLLGANEQARAEFCADAGAEGAGDAKLWQRVVSGCFGTDAAEAAKAHLARYGDRSPNDLKLEQITARQQPELLVGVIRPYLRSNLSLQAGEEQEQRTRREAEASLRRVCRSPLRRAAIRLGFAALRWSVRSREDARFARTQLFGLSRDVLLRLGAVLADHGLLGDAREVVDLTVEEVLGAFEGTLPGTGLRQLAAVRRAERERCAALPDRGTQFRTPRGLPLALVTPQPSQPLKARPAPAAGVDTSVELRGMGSSAGRVRGVAKVVLHPGVGAEDCEGRILVARETDPGWLFLMTVAKGIVVERGTPLSHTAITGRLLGLPTVVAVAAVTDLVRDGDLVELDGAAGTVRVLARAEAAA
jgi:pyruvate,water dikinase